MSDADKALLRAGDLMRVEHFAGQQEQLAAHAEALKLMHEAMLAMADELRRLRRGDPPAGVHATY